MIKIDGKEYHLIHSWSEVTFKDYCSIVKAQGLPMAERLSAYSGIPKDLCLKMTMAQFVEVAAQVAFMDDWAEASVFSEAYTDDLNIGKRKYKEIEEAKIMIQKAGMPILACADLIRIYYGEDITDQPVIQCLGKCSHVINSINSFLQKFKRLNEYEPTLDEQEAGVEELSKFGFFATAVQLARKYGKTHDEILDMKAEEVYTTLLYDFEQSVIEKNLMKIQTRKMK